MGIIFSIIKILLWILLIILLLLLSITLLILFVPIRYKLDLGYKIKENPDISLNISWLLKFLNYNYVKNKDEKINELKILGFKTGKKKPKKKEKDEKTKDEKEENKNIKTITVDDEEKAKKEIKKEIKKEGKSKNQEKSEEKEKTEDKKEDKDKKEKKKSLIDKIKEIKEGLNEKIDRGKELYNYPQKDEIIRLTKVFIKKIYK